MKDLGLYIHIPFCEKKCFYCDFNSFTQKGVNIEKYKDNLIKELSLYKHKLEDFTISTIFIGGGTPSSIDGNNIADILEHINNNFRVRKNAEITIEVNPGTLDTKKAMLYKSIGINRVSIGVQTLKEDLLKLIGRIHTVDDFYKSYRILVETGFSNINVDLMFGLPNQNILDIIETLDIITQLDIKHISFYSLILEEGTLMNQWYKDGKISLPNEDEEREMYHSIIDYLAERDYNQYEISNFAKKGYECIHNINYWKVKPYLGIGISSHSNMEGKRFWNHSSLLEYYAKLEKGILPIEGEETIDTVTEISEFCILGLRLIHGIDKEEFKHRFGIEIDEIYRKQIDKHVNGELLIEDEKSIRLSRKGLDLSNLVELDFFLK